MVNAHGTGQQGEGGSGYPRDEVWGEQHSSPFVSEQTCMLTPPPCFGPSSGGAGRL